MHDNGIEELITKLYDMVQDARSLPLGADKCIVERDKVLDMLDEIRQKYDLSILFSTHDFSTLRHYADKVILLQQAILKVGTPGEVLHSPEFQAVFHLNLGEEGGCAQ